MSNTIQKFEAEARRIFKQGQVDTQLNNSLMEGTQDLPLEGQLKVFEANFANHVYRLVSPEGILDADPEVESLMEVVKRTLEPIIPKAMELGAGNQLSFEAQEVETLRKTTGYSMHVAVDAFGKMTLTITKPDGSQVAVAMDTFEQRVDLKQLWDSTKNFLKGSDFAGHHLAIKKGIEAFLPKK